jgi:hypothetical protein
MILCLERHVGRVVGMLLPSGTVLCRFTLVATVSIEECIRLTPQELLQAPNRVRRNGRNSTMDRRHAMSVIKGLVCSTYDEQTVAVAATF